MPTAGRTSGSAGAMALGMSHMFTLTAGSRNLGSWSKVSGLSVKWDLAEHRVGSSDQYFKFAGIPKFDKLKLGRAAEKAGTTAVKAWLDAVAKSGGIANVTATCLELLGFVPPDDLEPSLLRFR